MASKNKRGFIVVALVVALGATTYLILRHLKVVPSLTKLEKINAIVLNPASKMDSSDINGMMTFGDDYINAWYDGLKAKQQTFLLNGKQYYTQGGTAVK